MKLDQLILELQIIQEKFGGDMMVATERWISGDDGGSSWPE